MAKVESLANAKHLTKTALYDRLAPRAMEAFRGLQREAFAAGALDVKTKELIAVGCAHVLRCPYCIDHHVTLAVQAGASREEVAEAVWVAVATGAGACAAHAAIAMNALNGRGRDYYDPENMSALAEFGALYPRAKVAYDALKEAVFSEGVLPTPTKELIATACAHNTRCPYCINAHVQKSRSLGLSPEELAEAIWVAIEMGAGACFGHAGLAAALLE